MRLPMCCISILFVVDMASPLVNNSQIEARNDLDVETRRKGKSKQHQSTSSSDNDRKDSDSSHKQDSLDMSDSITSSGSNDKRDKGNPKSSAERKGWRKWHRKCTPCPEDMRMKWRDPSIKWICGGYQRARRSFKSLCMMHYRNCQDGTMFTKIHDHRCANSSVIHPHGDHFFYDYKVHLNDEDSKTKSSESSSVQSESDDS